MFIRTENFSQYVKSYPIVTTLLILNILIYLFGFIPGYGDIMYLLGMGSNYHLAAGEWWRLFTPMFLHAGFSHLLMNMFSLFIFGPELERFAGKFRFLNIYLISGVLGNVATFLFEPINYLSVGASGAIFGIFGAFGALVYYTHKVFPALKQIILPMIVLGVIMTFLGSNINASAHIGGLVTGFAFGLYFFHPRQLKRRLKRINTDQYR